MGREEERRRVEGGWEGKESGVEEGLGREGERSREGDWEGMGRKVERGDGKGRKIMEREEKCDGRQG